MKRILAAILLLSCYGTFAQCTNGITTNPSAPVNTQRPDKLNTFNWTNLLYNVNSQYITTPQIDAPFNQTDNLNVDHFLNNQDRLPQDGWELIKYDFGFNPDGTPKTTPVGFVYLVLYNKYTGLLRVFVAGDRPAAYNGARLEMKFSSGTQTSALSNASELFALDRFDASPRITRVSSYNNNNGKWFYGDFHISYDPCTCFYESSMAITITLINQSHINLVGSITGTLTNIDSGTGTVDKNGFSFSPKDLLSLGQKAIDSYNSVDDFRTAQEKALQMNGKTDAELEEEKRNKRHTLNKFQQFLNESSLLKAGLKAAPFISGALEIVNFFVGGGKKQTTPEPIKIAPIALQADVKLQGTLTADFNYGDVTFYTPGSLNAHTKNPVNYAYYNEVLGVVNLLQAPVVKFRNTITSSGNNTTYKKNLQLQLPSVQYVLNPASGLRSDNIEVTAALVFYLKTDGSERSETAAIPLDLLSSYNFTLTTSRTQLTPTTLMETYGPCNKRYELNSLYLKLYFNLTRVNSDANTQNVLYVAQYPVTFATRSNIHFSYGHILHIYR